MSKSYEFTITFDVNERATPALAILLFMFLGIIVLQCACMARLYFITDWFDEDRYYGECNFKKQTRRIIEDVLKKPTPVYNNMDFEVEKIEKKIKILELQRKLKELNTSC